MSIANGLRRRHSTWPAALALIACATLFAVPAPVNAATRSATGPATTYPGGPFHVRNKTIGYSVYDLMQPYWQTFAKGIKVQAAADGYKVIVTDEKSSEQQEVAGSETLVNDGVSALIVSPVQPSGLIAIDKAANKAHIPIIVGDVGAMGSYDAYIFSNNAGGGALAATYVKDKLPKTGTSEVGVIDLHPGSAAGVLRVDGFTGGIKGDSHIKVVASLNGNDTVAGGLSATESMITANPGIKAIFCANDAEAEGAVAALKQAGMKGVLVVGFNGDAPAAQLIKQGEMAATVVQNPYGMGKDAVTLALALLAGKSITYTIPATRTITFPVALLNKSNINTYDANTYSFK